MSSSPLSSFIMIVVLGVTGGAQQVLAGQAELDALLAEMEVQVAALVDTVEGAHARRCDLDVISEAACGDKNYHACGTILPNPQCNVGVQEIPKCGISCSLIKDYTVSTVNVKGVAQRDQPNLNTLIKETICWTRLLDETFLAHDAAHAANASFPTHADRPPWSYFGHESTGLMRSFPGGYDTFADQCGAYDPRIRPWYTSAIAPPKDTIILLDASGSMTAGGGSTLALARRAVASMISRFSSSDSFAVLAFGSRVVQVYPDDGHLARGRESDKANAAGAMEQDLRVGPAWDGVAAFNAAFDLLTTGIGSSGCRKSIVLFTDNSNSATELPGVLAAIEARDDPAESATIFTYSVGERADRDGGIGKSIACATGGIWAAIPDNAQDMTSVMSGYYTYFAAAVAPAATHVVWSEPYTYTDGSLGVSVVSPAFDRTVEGIPRLIGVASMDFLVRTMESIMGDGVAARAAVLATIAQRATSSCPSSEVSECDLQSLRRASGGLNAMCDDQCASTIEVVDNNACRVGYLYPPEDDAGGFSGAVLHNDVWRGQHGSGQHGSSRSSCCTPGRVYDRYNAYTTDMCDIVQEGEQELSEETDDGITYLLLQNELTWQAARDVCINSHGGKLAHLHTEAQMDRVVGMMGAAGVNNAWICNEIASPGASTGLEGEFTAWGSDVTIVEGESGYYEPAKRVELVPGECPEAFPDKPFEQSTPSCPDVLALTTDCGSAEDIKRKRYLGGTCSACPSQPYSVGRVRDTFYQGSQCRGYQGMCDEDDPNCQCTPQMLVDGDCDTNRCDGRHQLTYAERECFDPMCPPGKRVRRDVEEFEWVNSVVTHRRERRYRDLNEDGDFNDRVDGQDETYDYYVPETRRNRARVPQIYTGPMCAHVRRHIFDQVSGTWTNDWGEANCHHALPFICQIGGDQGNYQTSFDHCHPYTPPLHRPQPSPPPTVATDVDVDLDGDGDGDGDGDHQVIIVVPSRGNGLLVQVSVVFGAFMLCWL